MAETRIELRRANAAELADYGQVPMTITVRSWYRLELTECGLGGWSLTEAPVVPAYDRDYDAAGPPTRRLRHGDISKWAVFAVCKLDDPPTRQRS